MKTTISFKPVKGKISLRSGEELSATLWDCKEIPPIHIRTLLRSLDEAYKRTGTLLEVQEAFGLRECINLFIYDEGKILLAEDYNRWILSLQCPYDEKDKIFKAIKSHMMKKIKTFKSD